MTDTVDTAARHRRIDALVAERVMGWAHAGDDPALQWGDKGPMWQPRKLRDDGDGWVTLSWIRLPAFTESWDAAGQVVERMRQDGFTDFVVTTGTDDCLFTVGFHKRDLEWIYRWPIEDGMSKQPISHESTFPLAVCLAALKALGVEVPG